MRLRVFLLFLVVCSFLRAQDRVQLGSLRAHFVNQKIIVNGNFMSVASSSLVNWQFVKEKRGRFVTDYLKEVPSSIVGQTGTIVAVVAPPPVFGPPPDESDGAFVQFGEAIIHLDSGPLIETALYSTFLKNDPGDNPGDAFSLASVRDRHKQEAQQLAEKLVGKSLYLTRLTRIYDMGLSTANLETLKAGVGYSDAEILNFPLLTPIKVIDTRYLPEQDGTIVELQLPDGRKAQYILGCIEEIPTPKKACASTTMPTFLTPKEAESIRKGSIFVGMSEAALYMTMGFPKETNGAAIGDTQLVYLSAYVYIDKNGRVVEIQDRN